MCTDTHSFGPFSIKEAINRKVPIWTIGGNHTRYVYAQLRRMDPNNIAYTRKQVVVYLNLSDDEAELIGAQHNRDNDFRHSMSNVEMVHYMRAKFKEHGSQLDGDLKKKIGKVMGWDSDKLLAMDNWIQVACRPKSLWRLIKQILKRFKKTKEQIQAELSSSSSGGVILGKKRKHGRDKVKTKTVKAPKWKDISVTPFKALQGLPLNEQERLLSCVVNDTYDLTRMQSEAKNIHILLNIRKCMCDEIGKLLNTKFTWLELKEKFPRNTREADVDQFLLDFAKYSKKNQVLSEKFLSWCSNVVHSAERVEGILIELNASINFISLLIIFYKLQLPVTLITCESLITPMRRC